VSLPVQAQSLRLGRRRSTLPPRELELARWLLARLQAQLLARRPALLLLLLLLLVPAR
jgi:hypothetical protein